MPTLLQWSIFFYTVIVMSLFIIIINVLLQSVTISNNWNSVRCNPVYMLFSGDVEKNFTYCIQNIQTSMMGQVLQPITWSMSNLASVSSLLTEGLNDTREMFDSTRTFITSIVQMVFGTFLNLVVEFQKISLTMKDVGNKIIGTMTTLLFVLDGTNKTMLSAWNGPPGQLTRKLGSCFELNQKINNKYIIDYKIGEIIQDNVYILNIIYIDQDDNNEDLYNFNNIIVSGSHCIFNGKEFIKIKNHPESKYIRKTNSKEKLICFITNTHTIPINNYIFGDYTI